MKKALAVIFAIALATGVFSGCDATDKIAEKATEKVIEKAAGSGIDVDLDNSKIEIKDEDGNKTIIGSTEWPKGNSADLIPEFKKGKIEATMNGADGCSISISGVEKSDFDDYVNELKAKGFTNSPFEMTSDATYMYSANLDEKTNASVSFNSDEKTLIILCSINNDSSSEDSVSEDSTE